MDSKNIYIATQHALKKTAWIIDDENEWAYVGDKQSLTNN